jgi:hypothetical protein
MDNLEFHELADLFPLMSDEELDALGDDMLQNGQRESIALFGGKILDGRNRYRACLLKGIEPRFLEQRPADPAAFVASANLHRRHLDESQRAVIAARLATMKQGARTDLSPAGEISQAKAATLLHIGKRSVERGRAVLDHGVPDLVAAVERGDVAVSAASEFAKATGPIDQARLIAEHGSPAAAVKAANALKRSPADIAKANRAAAPMPKAKPDVSAAADLAGEQARRKAEQRTVSEGVMRTLDLFERDNIDPSDRAAAVIDRFNLAIAEASRQPDLQGRLCGGVRFRARGASAGRRAWSTPWRRQQHRLAGDELLRRDDEGGECQGVRHGSGLVRGPAGSNRSAQYPPGATGERRRSVSSSAGSRYLNYCRQGDVSDVGRICRV